MEEFTGQLIGGPGDGNLVTASVPRIPVIVTTKMWLDGQSDDKDVTISEHKGSYYWNKLTQTFKWSTESLSFFDFKKKLEV